MSARPIKFSAEGRALIDRLHDVVFNNARFSAEQIAETLSISRGHLSNALNTGDHSITKAVPRLDWLIPIVRKTDDYSPLNMIEASLGRFAFPLPTHDYTFATLLQAEVTLCEEMADVFRTLKDCRHPGSPGGLRIIRDERDRVTKEILDVAAALGALMQNLTAETTEVDAP